jgi:hypothetical protein
MSSLPNSENRFAGRSLQVPGTVNPGFVISVLDLGC